MNNLQNLNQNKLIITKNENSEIKKENKDIIPFFSSSIYLKDKILKKINKYNITLLNPLHSLTGPLAGQGTKKFTQKVISFKEILSLFLKGFNIYNLNLNKYLLTHKNLDLIEELVIKTRSYDTNEYYKLNIRLKNFLFIFENYWPPYKGTKEAEPFENISPLNNELLFFPKRELKPYRDYSYRLRYFLKDLLLTKKDFKNMNSPAIMKLATSNLSDHFNISNNVSIEINTLKKLDFKEKNRQLKIKRRILNKILKTGINLMKDLNLLIYKKKILVRNLYRTNYGKGKINPALNISQPSPLPLINSSLKNETLPFLEDKGKSEPKSPIALIAQKVETSNPVSLFYYSSLSLPLQSGIPIMDQGNTRATQENVQFVPLTRMGEVKVNNSNNLLNNDNKENLNLNMSHSVNVIEESKPILNLYLKEMSIYNMMSKGIFIHYSNIIGFNFNRENNKLYKNIYKLLAASFKSMYCLISKPVFIITPDKIIIQLFYYLFIPNILKLKKIYKYNNINKKMFKGKEWLNRKKKLKKQYSKFRKIKLKVRIKLRNLSNITLTKIFSNKFKNLSLILNKFFKKPVEFDLIRLHYPYNDSNILVNLLGIMINKIKLRIIIRRLFEKAVIKNLNKLSGNKVNIIPAFLSGITIRVAGRLLTHRVVPRQTVKTTRRGASAKGKINFKDVATYTNKNKRGAFSITVKSGQNFF